MSLPRLTAILDHLPLAILLLDTRGTIMFATQPVSKMLGFHPKHLIATNAFEKLPGRRRIKHAFDCYVSRPNAVVETILPLKQKNGAAIRTAITLVNLLHEKEISAVLVTVRPV